MARMKIQLTPGLHRMFGVYACCEWNKVLVDPLADTTPGGNACVMHEIAHAEGKHALIGIIVLVLTLGTLYPLWRKIAETVADRVAAYHFPDEFRAFVYMHPHPKSRWGRYLYENTPEERYERGTRRGRWSR